VEVDATLPAVNVSAVANGITVSASDAGAGLDTCALAYREEQGTWQQHSTACSGTDTFEGLQPRVEYTFHLTATDNVGNEGQDQDSASVREVTKYYHFGGQRVAMRQPDGEVAWLHGDHLGSTSLATDESGAAISRQLYTPFGQARWVTGTLPTDFGFTGQRNDAYTQLVQMGARWYDSRIGRWISPDTIVPDPANPQSINRYAYVYNNP
jgi:RHS repeat-associated protein